MPRYSYDRLSVQDNEFLLWERPGLPMHIAGLQIFELGPLANEHGGVDFDKVRRMTEAVLYRIPRYRQKLAWIPGEDHAVWVDDPDFNSEYHIRHTSLPRPGTRTQLKRLMGRLMEQPLDRAKPLWELWVLEGLEGGQFATVLKTHHCMIDGSAGVDLASKLFSTNREYHIPRPPKFFPRPMPSNAELWGDEWKRRIMLPMRAIEELRTFYRSHTADLGADLARRARAAGEMLGLKVLPASETPLNGPGGVHRLVELASTSLEEMREIRMRFGCSINDVVLATVTGAVRAYMLRHQVHPEHLDFRVQTPVNIRTERDKGKMGNQVSSWIVRLPLTEEDPAEQLGAIHKTTQELKRTHQSDVVEMVYGLLEWIHFDMQSFAKGTANMVVTNVPGPQFPLYFLGAELLETYPLVTLLDNVGLGIALLSYNGTLYWGFNADLDRVPDLSHFAELIERSFEKLRAAEPKSVVAPKGTARRVRRKRKTKEMKKVSTRRKAVTFDVSEPGPSKEMDRSPGKATVSRKKVAFRNRAVPPGTG